MDWNPPTTADYAKHEADRLRVELHRTNERLASLERRVELLTLRLERELVKEV